MGSYYDDYINKTKKSIDEQKTVLKKQQTTADQIAKDRLNADNETLEKSYGTQIDETTSSYDTALKTNEVQKVLNERSIARRMAEMGLTDSGLNRTQSTAVQLSYANQKGNLIADRQKAVETLAAAMRSQMAQNQLTYNESVANNKLAYESGIANIDAQVDKDASEYETTMIKAENEAAEAQRQSYSNLVNSLADSSLSSSSRLAKIEAYRANYGLSNSDYENLKSLVGSVESKPNFDAVNKAKNNIVSEDDFYKNAVVIDRIGGRRGNVIGKKYSYGGKTYLSYKGYVEAQLQDMYEKYGIIGEPELRDLLEYYKI